MTKHFFPELTPSEQGAILRLWAASVAVAEEMPMRRSRRRRPISLSIEVVAFLLMEPRPKIWTFCYRVPRI